MKKDKLLYSTVCHEYGHATMLYLLGYADFVQGIEIINNYRRIDGHTILCHFRVKLEDEKPITEYLEIPDEDELRQLFGGCVMEKICGYYKRVALSGTDKEKVYAITKDKVYINSIRKEVETMLLPYKDLILKFTYKTIDEDIWEDNETDMYIRVIKDDINKFFEEVDLLKQRNKNL